MPSELRRRRNAERKAQTRQRLLDAAARVFAEQGYHTPRISDIVQAASVGQGTFYRHFDSKRAVLDALFDRLLADLLAEFKPLSEHLPDSLESYRAASQAVVVRLAEVVQSQRDLVLVLLRQGPSIDPDFETKLAGTYDRFAQMARFYLEHAIASGFARSCDAGVVSQALIGMALRLVDNWLADRLGERTVEQVIAELIDFAFLGFGQAGPERSNGA